VKSSNVVYTRHSIPHARAFQEQTLIVKNAVPYTTTINPANPPCMES